MPDKYLGQRLAGSLSRCFGWWTSMLVIIALTMGLTGCIADEDRCMAGYTYLPDEMACLENVDTAADTDTEIETQIDGGKGDASGGDSTSGLGEECTDDDDCADYNADFCVTLNNPGYCTITECEFGDCPAGYQCCDCSNLGFPKACATQEDVDGYGPFCVECG